MAANLVLVPEAAQDIAEACAWYEDRRCGLGAEFVSCVDGSFQRISRTPEMYAKVHQEYRRALVRRFPYAVFYEYAEGMVTIYCVFHTSREPEKWRRRLP